MPFKGNIADPRPSFKVFFEMSGLPQDERGAVDKYHPKVQRTMWRSIVQRIQQQLPSEYRRLKYVGPMPPTDKPLFSRKLSDQVTRAHLFFGHHKHDPTDRIRVEIGRRGNMEWKVLAFSVNA